MEKKSIESFKLSITWSDGKTEGLANCLPEYLEAELRIYFLWNFVIAIGGFYLGHVVTEALNKEV